MRRYSKIFIISLVASFYSAAAGAQTASKPIPLPAPFECAQAGQMICQLELGKAYAFGSAEWGLSPDYERALFWLKQKPGQDRGYGPNVQAIMIIDAIEKYQATGDTTAIQQAKKDYSPSDDNAKNPFLENTQDQSGKELISDALSKEKYREWKINLIRYTVIGAVIAIIFFISVWFAYRRRQHLGVIAQRVESQHRILNRANRFWRFLSSRKVRFSVALYLLWLLLLLFTNSFEFEDIFNMHSHDIERFQILAILPSIFLVAAYAMITWALRARPESEARHD